MLNFLKSKVKNKAKKVFIKTLLPYIMPLLAIALIISFTYIFIMTIFIQFTGARQITGNDVQDQTYKKWAQEALKTANSQDIYIDGNKSYNVITDYYGRDQQLKLTEGQILTVAYFKNSTDNTEITKDMINTIANDLHPVLKYKSYETVYTYEVPVKDDKGNVTVQTQTVKTNIYLLTDADTIMGHFTYSYKKKGQSGTTYDSQTGITEHWSYTTWVPDSQQLIGQPYERLDNYIKRKFKDPDNSVAIDRQMVIEAGNGYDEQQERVAWLMSSGNVLSGLVSAGTIPPEILPLIQDASKKYGIPEWFIAAVIQQESSFNPMAVNSSTGALGLMQVMPDNWKHYSTQLGFDPDKDMFNPKAQIEVGTYMLKGYLGNIDWNSPDWKEQTLKGLAGYGGFRGFNALERCRAEYAEKIWAYTEGFRLSLSGNVSSWPAIGSYQITSPFGYRKNPITGALGDFHPGIDIAAPEGSQAVAVANGKVVVAGWVSGYGNTIVIRDTVHDYLYGHLSHINVSVGQTVTAGQMIGLTGITGNSTGPHLHFGVSIGDWTKGNWIDPMTVLRP